MGNGGKKLQINPTNPSHPTRAMLHKALKLMIGVGLVECVELYVGFIWGVVSVGAAASEKGAVKSTPAWNLLHHRHTASDL
jgi:hypothetical protein